MNIESHAMELSKILTLDDNARFNIPDYQRHYSWKPDQIDQLFNDIMNEEKEYYIGNLLITKNDNAQDTDVKVYDVIDGQQRLTTLSLFLLAIWERAQEWLDNDDTPKPDIKSLIRLQADIKRRLLVNEDVDTPRLQLLDDDDVIYAKLLQVLKEDDDQHIKARVTVCLPRDTSTSAGYCRTRRTATSLPSAN